MAYLLVWLSYLFCQFIDENVNFLFPQVLRDLALMSTDLFHVALSLYELRGYAIKKRVPLSSILMQRNSAYIALIVFTTMFFLVCLLQ